MKTAVFRALKPRLPGGTEENAEAAAARWNRNQGIKKYGTRRRAVGGGAYTPLRIIQIDLPWRAAAAYVAVTLSLCAGRDGDTIISILKLSLSLSPLGATHTRTLPVRYYTRTRRRRGMYTLLKIRLYNPFLPSPTPHHRHFLVLLSSRSLSFAALYLFRSLYLALSHRLLSCIFHLHRVTIDFSYLPTLPVPPPPSDVLPFFPLPPASDVYA